jgi:phosphoglucosamine mutase
MVESDQDLHSLKSGMHKMPQTMINVAMPRKLDPMLQDDVVAAVRDVESLLGQRGRVLLRPSGTEPVVRVMIEGEDRTEVDRLCSELAGRVEKSLKALAS